MSAPGVRRTTVQLSASQTNNSSQETYLFKRYTLHFVGRQSHNFVRGLQLFDSSISYLKPPVRKCI